MTFENAVSKILEEGHVKRMRIPRRAWVKRLMTVDDAEEVCRDYARSVRLSLVLVLKKYKLYLALNLLTICLTNADIS